jgi:hypothetical protein
LNSQLASQKIVNGHAFDKHVLYKGEFNSLGIRTCEQFNNTTDVRYYSDSRLVYLDSNTELLL